MLREKGSGKFETRRAVTLSFKLRIYRRSGILQETDKEKLLLCYQTNRAILAARFPLTRELALELAALMAQVCYISRAVNFTEAALFLNQSFPIPN
jgi:hypothetical protein